VTEVRAAQFRGWWWRLDLRTNGIALGVHWPRKGWDQWQVSLLMFSLSFGRM
jgi:hypothetical protein